MTDSLWAPSASLATLHTLAKVRAAVRDFMAKGNVLEVCTPALSQAAATDPHVHSFALKSGYLHTSPEYPMKRLLVAYGVDIYQLATVFRDEEYGRYHNPEFSMLEWYRVGFDHQALMQEVAELLAFIWAALGRAWQPPNTVSYGDAISTLTGKHINELAVTHIEQLFEQRQRSYPSSIGNDLDTALMLTIDEFVLPTFAKDRATFLVDYPASQAALARIGLNAKGEAVAERFELYWGELELANGFHELSDAQEQRHRFNADLRVRKQAGSDLVPLDEHLLSALQHGLPDCAGVALGVDRLMMLLTDAPDIQSVMAFSAERA